MSYYRQWRKKMGYVCERCDKEIRDDEETVEIHKCDGEGDRIVKIHKECPR